MSVLFYRCTLCNRPVAPWDIAAGGCPTCGGRKVVPTNLSFMEKVRQILRRPMFWRWEQ